MEKPVFSLSKPDAEGIAKLKEQGEKRGAMAIIGRVIYHAFGQDRVEYLRLEDDSEVILRKGATVAKWPSIEYVREEMVIAPDA